MFIQLLRKSRHRARIEEPTKQETNQPSNQETCWSPRGSCTLPKFRAPQKHEIQGGMPVRALSEESEDVSSIRAFNHINKDVYETCLDHRTLLTQQGDMGRVCRAVRRPASWVVSVSLLRLVGFAGFAAVVSFPSHPLVWGRAEHISQSS